MSYYAFSNEAVILTTKVSFFFKPMKENQQVKNFDNGFLTGPYKMRPDAQIKKKLKINKARVV